MDSVLSNRMAALVAPCCVVPPASAKPSHNTFLLPRRFGAAATTSGPHTCKAGTQKALLPRISEFSRPTVRVQTAKRVSNSGSGSGLKAGDYIVSLEDCDLFREQGYVHLPGVLTEQELAQHIEAVYDSFVRGEIEIPGNDFCDMGTSASKDKSLEDFSIVNVMLPRMYMPSWQGNLFERRTHSIVHQLLGRDPCECAESERMAIDYDQILAKRPGLEDGTFAWHQDMAYWPPFTASQETATCWLALDDSNVGNGCMRFLPGSHREGALRPHSPVARMGREESHALYTPVDEEAEPSGVHYVEISRGDITVHNERVVHGSGANQSDRWRRAYVVAYRREDCIAEERSIGFTHSHNDVNSWDQFHEHQRQP